MIQKISEPVSVNLIFDNIKLRIFPEWLIWQGRSYSILRVGLHHTYRKGRTLYHVFSVASATLSFRLVLNTDSLHWELEEVSDGMPS